jgi:hypothetical protein
MSPMTFNCAAYSALGATNMFIHRPLMHKLDNAMETNDHAKPTHETPTQTSHATQRTRETETTVQHERARMCFGAGSQL